MIFIRHGGGVLCYINNLFTHSVVFKGTDSFECIVLSMFCSSRQHSPDLTIALLYRPPNSCSSLFDTLFCTLCNLDVSVFSNFVLLGDFNIDYFCTQSPLFSRLNSVTSSFNLTQLVTEPTRVCGNSCTLIDLIFVSTPAQVKSCHTTPPLANSDHFGLQLNISSKSSRKRIKISQRVVWRYSHADSESIADILDTTDWDELLDDDVDSSWSRWKKCFLHTMSQCIPRVTIKSERRVPWVTHAIKQAMRKRKTLFNKAKSTGDPQDLAIYKQQRNHVLNMLRESRQAFFSNLDAANAKVFWKTVKMLGTKSTTFPTISNGSTQADTSEGKAYLLNNFFYSCYNRSCPSLTPNSPESNLQTNLDPSNFPEYLKCSPEYVANMLAMLDTSKSSGPDDISSMMLKSTAYSIAPSLAKLFNTSLAKGALPTEWKLARVVPVPKSDDLKNSVSGYRPISILPTVSKILEHHVSKIIVDHICEAYPISDRQWGFMLHRSSTSALISVIYDWLTALDNGQEVCVVFFDIQKAFDSVPHLPLLQKLEQIGINPYILRWVQSYLTERRQFVVVEGSCSPTLQVVSGVPQGSVLGPLLFVIYLNDVADCISGGSKINLFADDIALYRIITNPDDYLTLQADVNAIKSTLTTKYLTLNPKKCCCLFISRKRVHSIPPPCLTLGHSPLAHVSSYKYLGLTITSDLMWSIHIANICSKTRRLIGLLYRRFYKYSSPNTLLKLYVSFIRPHLEYASAAWDPFLKKDIDLIEDVQKFALKVCLKSWNSSYNDLLKQSNLLSLQARRHDTKLCHLYKIVNNVTFFPNAPTQTRQLTYSSRSVHPKAIVPLQAHSSQYLYSFFPSTIVAWNSLPSDTASAPSITSFKTALKH